MTSAQYLFRVDDACPSMHSERWDACERIFDRFGIKPIVAVVPDNRDPNLECRKRDPLFWNRVRAWQQKGWTIAMHGYQHQFHYVDRRKLILPFYDRSEFAGLSFLEQSEKIRAAWQIFAREQVKPTVWIAPAHCFDQTTLQAIERETPIRIISDGIARNQYYEDGFYWLPQQLWSFKEKTYGLWTICLHPNNMNYDQIQALEALLSSLAIRQAVLSVNEVRLENRSRDFYEKLYGFCYWQRGKLYAMFITIRSKLFFWRKHKCSK